MGFYFLGTFVISFALFKAGPRSPQGRLSVFDILFILVMTGIIIYYIVEYPKLAERMGSGVKTIDAVLGWGIILLSLEMARRTVGNIIPAIGVVLLIYAYFGPYFPLGLGHSGFSLARIAESLFLSGDGILGTMTNIFASYILIFVILGAFMEVSGCGKVFVDLAYAITGRVTGGPALASVITSALFGTVSGSAVANVVVDGVYTIPLMKRMGYKPHFAGAVEAATSTGGQLMPPVMGAAAFLLAEISGTPYITVIKIAAIPAILYYASVAVIIRLEAVKQKLTGSARLGTPEIRRCLPEDPSAPSRPDPHRPVGLRHDPLHRRLLHDRRDDHRQLVQKGHKDGVHQDHRGPLRKGRGAPSRWARSSASWGSSWGSAA